MIGRRAFIVGISPLTPSCTGIAASDLDKLEIRPLSTPS
jgi:hypothetical protein